MTEVTPPVLQGPSSKERRYDRQLRLWAASGQAALEDAHVLLINSGSGVVGVETLKNLVLPGIGQFTIQDASRVAEADLGVNFFLEDSDLGKYRAECCCRLLQELNPDVQGHAITEPLETWLADPKALQPYSLILLVLPVVPEIQETIVSHAERTGIVAFYIHCLGFMSHFSLQLPPAFPIVDTHPDPNSTTDLRLLHAWPELSALLASKTSAMGDLDDEAHGHIPYLLLILYYLNQWKDSHDGKVPQSYQEKSDFRDLVRHGARTNNAEGGEENFDEAVAAVLKNLNPPTASSAVKEVLEAEECTKLTQSSPGFWVIASAIRAFYATHSMLPLPGSVPDMKAKSSDYIELQTVYKNKARDDVAEVEKIVRTLEAALERPEPIDYKEIEAFCKSAAHIKLVRGRRPHVAKPGGSIAWKDRARFCKARLDSPESLLTLYIAFLAYDSYAASHELAPSNEPNASTEDSDTKATKIVAIAHKYIDDLIKEAGSTIDDPEYTEIRTRCADAVKEIVRADGGELHNIAALTGGMVAQEVIKAITKQYVPIDNTCLFDGITSMSSVLRL